MSPAVTTELQRQLNHELAAAHAYDAISIWCQDRNYKGFARFFYKQAGEEREHARKFIDHLIDRAVLPQLGSLPAPRMNFASVMEIALEAQKMEQNNTAGVLAAYEATLADKDYASQVLLQWFINEQVEEEAWTDELVDRVRRAECPGGMAELDRHIERHLTQKVVEESD
jgi:ferritin